MYYYGQGVKQDKKKAFELFLTEAQKGDKESMTVVGIMYVKGDGVQKSETKALEWLKKSAEKDYEPAMSALGTLYRNYKSGL